MRSLIAIIVAFALVLPLMPLAVSTLASAPEVAPTPVHGSITQYTGPAPTAPTEVVVEIEDTSVIVGGQGSTDIWVRDFPEDTDGLGSYTIRVDYDPVMVEITEVSPGDSPFDSPFSNILDDYVLIAAFGLDSPGPSGDVRIADLEFTCLSPGETTLVLTVDILSDVNGGTVEATPIDGVITQYPESVTASLHAPPEVLHCTEFIATANITYVMDFASYEFDLSYDPDIFEVTGVTAGSIDGTEVLVDEWSFEPPATQGMVTVRGSVSGVADVSGSGHLAEVHLHAVGSYCHTGNLTFSNGRLYDSGQVEITPVVWLDGSVHISGGTVGMIIDPTPKQVTLGETFTVDIVVTVAGGQPLDFAEAHLDFDPAKLQVEGVTEGGQFTNVFPVLFDNVAGTIDYAAGAAFDDPPATDDFVLATVEFTAEAQTAGTPLTFVFDPPLRLTNAFDGGESKLDTEAVIDGDVVITTGTRLDGQVTLQSRPAPPNPRWVMPLTVVLLEPGGDTVMAGPYDVSTNESGEFSVPGLPAGTYDVGVKGRRTLSRLATGVVLTGESVPVDFGTLVEGDASSDDYVGGADYSLLYTNYGQVAPAALEICDFNGDDYVGGADYSLLYTNYGQVGEMPSLPVP